MPVATRIASRLQKSQACAVAIEKIPNSAVATIRTFLRPIRSAKRPPSMAPGKSPNVPALKASPIWPTESPNSRAMRGAATPIDCRSSPSRSATTKHRPSVSATPEVASARTVVDACMITPLFETVSHPATSVTRPGGVCAGFQLQRKRDERYRGGQHGATGKHWLHGMSPVFGKACSSLLLKARKRRSERGVASSIS